MKIKEIILKIYEEYFELPEEGKIREKVFIARIAMSVIVMGIWMSMMGFSAYAFFSCSVTSGMNTIKSATYSLDITAPDGVAKGANGYVLENASETENQTFEFELVKAGDASVGYCKIITNEGIEQKGEVYTTPIGTYQEANGETVKVPSMKVQITVPPSTTMTVEFVANWGSYSGDNAVANVALDYGLSEEALNQLQAESDNATTTTQTENPVSKEADASDEKTEGGSSVTGENAVGGTETSSNETTGTTTDTTTGGAPTDTTSSGATDTTSGGVDDTSSGESNGTSDASQTDAEGTSQINEETTKELEN